MNNIVAQQKASTSQDQKMAGCFLELCHHLDLIPIPLKPKSKVPLVKWSDDSRKPTPIELGTWASKPGVNWGVRCGENLAVIDCDSEGAYLNFTATHKLPDCPVVKTGRGYQSGRGCGRFWQAHRKGKGSHQHPEATQAPQCDRCPL